tara:strand:+ start:231 stop:431 length:201 start_codon:yes stop_codon:yes gene_type:complete
MAYIKKDSRPNPKQSIKVKKHRDSEFLKGIVEAKKAGRPVSQAAIDRASQILQELQKKNKKFMTGR